MLVNGEAQKNAIRPDFNESIFIDFAGTRITSDAGFLLMREIDQRFGIIENGCRRLVEARSAPHRSIRSSRWYGSGCTRLRRVMKTATYRGGITNN